MLSSSDGNDSEKHPSRQKLLIAAKTRDGLRVHQVKTNTIQTGNCVRTEKKLIIK